MSEALKIPVTATTPEVVFDTEKGTLLMKGKSIPEDPTLFYEPLLKKVESYTKTPAKESTLTIDMEYFNTPSAKYLLEIFKHFEALTDRGNKVVVNWNYEQGDTDMLQAGKDYQGYLSKLTFILNETE